MELSRTPLRRDPSLAARIKRTAFTLTMLTVAALAGLLLVVTLFEIPTNETKANQNTAGVIGEAMSADLRNELENLHALSLSSLVSTALLDSTGREAYLKPFLQARGQRARAVPTLLLDYQGRPVVGNLPGIDPTWLSTITANVLSTKQAQVAVSRQPGRPALVGVYPVAFPYTDDVIGALAGAVDLTAVFQRRSSGLAEDMGADLLYQSTAIVFRPDERPAQYFPARFALNLGSDEADELLSLSVYSMQNPWFLPIAKRVLLAVLLAVLFGALIWQLADLAARRITRRLNALAAACAAISEGQRVLIPQDPTPDEIGMLARTLHRALTAQEQAAERLEQMVEQKTHALSVSEARFRSFFEKNSSVLLIVDPQSGGILQANRAAAAYYGYPLERLANMVITEISSTEPARLAEYARYTLRNGGNHLTAIHRLAWGEERHVEVYLTPIEIQDRLVLFSIVHDITERVLAEKALQASEERFRQAFVYAPLGIAVVALDGEVSDANPALCRMLGYAQHELAGTSLARLFVDGETGWQRIVLALEAGDTAAVLSEERTALRHDGQAVPVIFTLTRIRDSRGRPIGFIARIEDISQRKQAQLHELATGILAAQEQDRAKLSHELHDEIGQSLTALKITLKRAQSDLADQRRVNSCLDHGHRVLEQLMDDVRSIAHRLRPAEIDQLGLVAALRSHLDKTIRPLGQNVTLIENLGDARLPPSLELCCFRVVQEALTNSLRHAQASKLEVALHWGADGLRLSVKDDGIGLDISRYYSAQGNVPSLGLVGMRERVAANGGQLQIRSAKGEGTEVVATFDIERPAT